MTSLLRPRLLFFLYGIGTNGFDPDPPPRVELVAVGAQ